MCSQSEKMDDYFTLRLWSINKVPVNVYTVSSFNDFLHSHQWLFINRKVCVLVDYKSLGYALP